MCLLLFKPAGKSVPFDYIQNASVANPHGMGLSFADGNKVHIKKNIKWGVHEFADEIERLEDFPLIAHFRWATTGGICKENLHPFPLPGKWTAGHNGTIDTKDLNIKGDETDTSAFLREFVAPILKKRRCLTDKSILESIEHKIGSNNKLVFLHASGKVSIANEKMGHFNDGVWYSNYTYEAQEPYFGGFGEKRGGFWKFDAKELECSMCGDLLHSREFFVEGDTGYTLCESCQEYYMR